MTTSSSYDLVILGGGAAVSSAITEADRRGLSTAMVNTGLPLGGTCVNVGCVPSKQLLEVGKTAHEPPNNPFDAVEYDDDQPATDWAATIDGKNEIVGSLREQNYVDVADHFGTDIYEGYGRLVDETTIEVVDGVNAGTTITRKKRSSRPVVLRTSRPSTASKEWTTRPARAFSNAATSPRAS